MSTRVFTIEIPDGYEITYSQLRIAGITHFRSEVMKFIFKDDIRLTYELEPDNRYDPNAILIIGLSKGFFGTKNYKLGYIPADKAKRIYKRAKNGEILLLLKRIYLADENEEENKDSDSYIDINFQIANKIIPGGGDGSC